MTEKIFGIGLNKTGSYSLHQALEILNYKSIHSSKILKNIFNNQKLIKKYNCFINFPEECPYEKLYEKFPNAKFILTTRNIEDWIRSRTIHVLHNRILKTSSWNNIETNKWESLYNRYHSEVFDFFKDKDNFLYIDICSGEGWEKLCSFLGKENPNIPFPNSRSSLEKLIDIYRAYSSSHKKKVDVSKFNQNNMQDSIEESLEEKASAKVITNDGNYTLKDCSVVVTCKGRLDHLKESIGHHLNQNPGEYILVDYEDPEECGKWAKDEYGDRVTVAYPKALKSPYFNLSHARNCGAKISKGKILIFLDADVMPCDNWLSDVLSVMNSNPKCIIARVKDIPENWSKTGTCVVLKEAFLQARGYRESMDRWGFEDVDFYKRIETMGDVFHYHGKDLGLIEHDNELRTQNYPEKDKELSQTQMETYMKTVSGMVNPEDYGLFDPLEKGVMTASDSKYFPGLKILYKSIQRTKPFPFRCIDIGLTSRQRDWCSKNSLQLINIKDIISLEIIERFEDESECNNLTTSKYLWPRPWFVGATPFRDTIWIDSDAIVTKPLTGLFERIENGVAVFVDSNHPESTPNNPELYNILPVPEVTNKHVNSGVLGTRKERDDDLLYWWKYCVELASKNKKIRSNISWHDQGCLIWALHKTDRIEHISSDISWNHPPHGYNHKNLDRRKKYKVSSMFEDISKDHPMASIVHYMAKPKLWDLIYDME